MSVWRQKQPLRKYGKLCRRQRPRWGNWHREGYRRRREGERRRLKRPMRGAVVLKCGRAAARAASGAWAARTAGRPQRGRRQQVQAPRRLGEPRLAHLGGGDGAAVRFTGRGGGAPPTRQKSRFKFLQPGSRSSLACSSAMESLSIFPTFCVGLTLFSSSYFSIALMV